MEEIKTCRICSIDYPATTEYFYKNKSSKDGLHSWCKYCTKEKSLKRFEDNRKEDNERRKRWYEENKEHTLKRQKVSNENNKESNKINQSIWRKENKDKVKIYNLDRKLHKKHDITTIEWEICREYFNFECGYCGISEIEAKEKYGQNLHKDHANPNGTNDISNCIPACKSCNSSKHDSELTDWYNSTNVNYTDERSLKIFKWLQGDYKLSNHLI